MPSVVQIRTQDLLSDEVVSTVILALEAHRDHIERWRAALDRRGSDARESAAAPLIDEERVLVALREKLMRKDLFEDFCQEYVRELNRLRMEHRAGLSNARTELATVEREIRKLVQAIKDGVSALSIKDELPALEARKAELQSRLNAPEMPELLHPRMSDVYREKVGSLCLALENEESRTAAREAIRALIEAILLEPDGDQLKSRCRATWREC
jgi:hypothetical protein